MGGTSRPGSWPRKAWAVPHAEKLPANCNFAAGSIHGSRPGWWVWWYCHPFWAFEWKKFDWTLVLQPQAGYRPVLQMWAPPPAAKLQRRVPGAGIVFSRRKQPPAWPAALYVR